MSQDLEIDVDVEVDDDDEILLLNSDKSKNKSIGKNFNLKKGFITVIITTVIIISIGFIAQIITKGYSNIFCSDIYMKENKANSNINNLPEGFVLVDPSIPQGPITVNKTADNGTKLNYNELINPEDDSFYYNEEEFNALKNITHVGKEVYFCELGTGFPPEHYKSYDIACPTYYTIAIDKVFYGRHAKDNKNCNKYYEGRDVEKEFLEVNKECGNEPIDNVKEICEGKNSCSLRPGGSHFKDSCPGKFKYLHITYHCVKDKEFKKERISVVMFSNIIKVNSIYENAISAFYQYSNIHGYDFQFNHYRYDTERQVFFMKLNSVLEKIIIGLKEKKYDWVFWVDSDVVLCNPNIKLESFLPDDNMSNIHLIASDDINGLNAGVFLIRVHPWSLNFIMRAMSYSYYVRDKGLKYADQSSMNNVLVGDEELDHYIIVPQNWFNSYIGLNKSGDFLLHLAGHVNKDDEAETFRDHIKNDSSWYGKTSKAMRKEVLKYYRLSSEEQHHIKIERK